DCSKDTPSHLPPSRAASPDHLARWGQLTQADRLALATSRSGRPSGPALALLKPIGRPPRPALGHSRHREQALDFVAVRGVGAKSVADGEVRIGSLDAPDLIPGPHIPLGDESKEGPGARRLGEAARKHLIVHPNSEPPARDSWLGNLKNRGADLPALPDE